MDGCFTPEPRQETLDRILTALEADERIIGVLVVGSGAVGFEDDLSDIDICIVASDEDAETVFRDWRTRFDELLPVVHCSEVIYGPGSYLYALLLDRFLELDAGFVAISKLFAERERWKVAFDRSGRIEEIMQRTWANREPPDLMREHRRRADGIWHHIMHCGQALLRGRQWRAIHYLEAVRTRTIELACIRLGLEAGHFRQVHGLAAEFLGSLQATLPASTESAELLRACSTSVDRFFEEAREWDMMLGTDIASTLEPKMREYTALVRDSLSRKGAL